jgi:two-component system, cell cycle response regulator DivK
MPKLLLVEDNEMNRDMIARYLEYHEYTVITASDGKVAVDLARTATPELILMDISLPSLDGWEATRQIKAAPETSHIPIIALTAHAMVADRQMSLEAGCNDYEAKPIDFARLLEKIHKLLQTRALPET